MTATTTAKKDSFDRFGDDLCQLLVQYLPIEDKLRLQSVSKQWLKVIFTSETQLVFDSKLLKRLSFESLAENRKTNSFFKIILKNCSNIQSVLISDIWFSDDYFELLMIYCHRLRHLYFQVCYNVNWLNRVDLFQRFCSRFGQQLLTFKYDRYVWHTDRLVFFKHIHRFVNLKTLDITCFGQIDILLSDIYDTSRPLMKTLQSVSLRLNSKSVPVFVMFAKTDGQLMTSLTISIDESIINDTNIYRQLLNSLSEMSQLRQLTIEFEPKVINNDIIDDILTTIGRNCRQLRALSLKLSIISVTGNHLFAAINKHLSPDLRRLSLYCLTYNRKQTILTSDQLNRFNRLTHLTLDLQKGLIISDQFFANIHRNLPRLQSIRCDKVDINKESVVAMGQLPYLMDVDLRDNTIITNESFISQHLLIGTKIKHLFIKCEDYNGLHVIKCGKYINCDNNVNNNNEIIYKPVIRCYFPRFNLP